MRRDFSLPCRLFTAPFGSAVANGYSIDSIELMNQRDVLFAVTADGSAQFVRSVRVPPRTERRTVSIHRIGCGISRSTGPPVRDPRHNRRPSSGDSQIHASHDGTPPSIAAVLGIYWRDGHLYFESVSP